MMLYLLAFDMLYIINYFHNDFIVLPLAFWTVVFQIVNFLSLLLKLIVVFGLYADVF